VPTSPRMLIAIKLWVAYGLVLNTNQVRSVINTIIDGINNVKNAILNSFKTLSSKKIDELIIDRMNKFTSMGVYSS